MSDLTLIIIAALTSGILFGIAGYSIKLIIDQRSQLASKNAINQQINRAVREFFYYKKQWLFRRFHKISIIL